TGVTPPGRPTHSIAYTPADQPSQYTPPDVNPGSDETHYTYNLDQQLTQVLRPDGQSVTIGYDSAGRPNALTTPDGAYSYVYSPANGTVTSVDAPGGIGLAYTYDGGLLTSRTWSGPVVGSVGYIRNNDFRVTSSSVNGGNTVTFQYDPDGLLTQAGALTLSHNAQNSLLTGTALGSTTDAWGYNSFGEPTSYSASYAGSPIYSAQYTRDALGRITQAVEALGGVTDTSAFSYDPAGRLSDVVKNAVAVGHYTYDVNGNRLTGPGVAVAATYDAQDRLLSYGGAGYTYTANGELQSKTSGGQTTAYQYD